MLDRLKDVCRNVQKLDPDKITKTVFNNKGVGQQVIDLNIIQMYNFGVDAEGETLGQYHPKTIKIKQEKGQRYDHVTLNDTGEFYDSIRVKGEVGKVIVSGDMKKPDTDLEKIFPHALGLNEKSLSEIREFTQPLYVKEVKRNILK